MLGFVCKSRQCWRAVLVFQGYFTFISFYFKLLKFGQDRVEGQGLRTRKRSQSDDIGVPPEVHIHTNTLRRLPRRLESLSLKFTNELEASTFVDGDLAELIKPSASDRQDESVLFCSSPNVPGSFHCDRLLGICILKVHTFKEQRDGCGAWQTSEVKN